MPENVDPQIVDAVTSTNVMIGAKAPAVALGNLFQNVAHSNALAAGNAVQAQQQSNVVHHASTTLGATILYTVGSASGGEAAAGASGDS